jgi:N-methylhydantoinase A
MHGTPVARELGITRIVVPPSPGILCAFGQLLADLRHDLIETHIFPYTPGNADRATQIAQRLSDAAERLLEADQVPPAKRVVHVRVEARYVGQSYELPIAFAFQDVGAWSRLAGDFHAAHRQRFGHADPDSPIEIVGLGATAIGKVDTPELPTLARGGSAPPAEARLTSREIFIEGSEPGDPGRWAPAGVWDRAKLLAGNMIAGPAVIEELSATTVLYPGDRATVHASGALLVECTA